MAQAIYKITPLVSDVQNQLTGKDEVPKNERVDKLRSWTNTPMGIAYRKWAKDVAGWDVDDMADWDVYSAGQGSNKIFWVPAKNNGVYGPAARYYWVPLRIERDIYAERLAEAEEIRRNNEAAAAIAEASMPVGGSPTMPLTVVPGLPPGPSGLTPGISSPGGAEIEFSVNEEHSGWWTARNPSASAAGQEGNPHKGISIINPGMWKTLTGDAPPKEALGLDEFKDRGWTGLDKKFVAWNDGQIAVASEELGSTMEAAEMGDEGALQALASVGVRPPPDMGQGGSLFGGLFG